MTHERSYRKALSQEEALAELERGSGSQFDPAVVEAFMTLVIREGQDVALAPASTEDEELTVAPSTRA